MNIFTWTFRILIEIDAPNSRSLRNDKLYTNSTTHRGLCRWDKGTRLRRNVVLSIVRAPIDHRTQCWCILWSLSASVSSSAAKYILYQRISINWEKLYHLRAKTKNTMCNAATVVVFSTCATQTCFPRYMGQSFCVFCASTSRFFHAAIVFLWCMLMSAVWWMRRWEGYKKIHETHDEKN